MCYIHINSLGSICYRQAKLNTQYINIYIYTFTHIH